MSNSQHADATPRVSNVFTLYDVFGYIIPGAALVFAIVLSRYFRDLLRLWSQSSERNLDLVFFVRALTHNWALSIVIGLLLTYLLGHVLASLSSMLLEKLLLEKALGLPTERMLRPGRSRGDSWRGILLGYRGSMGRVAGPAFRSALELRFGPAVVERDIGCIFRLCAASLRENCPVTYERVMHYVTSYGLARNTAMACILAAALTPLVAPPANMWFLLSTWILGAFLFFRQYLKLFRRVNEEFYFQFLVQNWPADQMDGEARDAGAAEEPALREGPEGR